MAGSEVKSLRGLLETILAEYPVPENIYNTARSDGAENYEIGDWSEDYRHDLIVNQSETVFDSIEVTEEYVFVPSVGQQNAPNIPYLAFVDTKETDTVQYGRNVVYLFDPYTDTVYLTLN